MLKKESYVKIYKDDEIVNYNSIYLPMLGGSYIAQRLYYFFLRIKFRFFSPKMENVVYFHFLHNAITIIDLLKNRGKFVFVGLGESNIHNYQNLFSDSEIKKSLVNLKMSR